MAKSTPEQRERVRRLGQDPIPDRNYVPTEDELADCAAIRAVLTDAEAVDEGKAGRALRKIANLESPDKRGPEMQQIAAEALATPTPAVDEKARGYDGGWDATQRLREILDERSGHGGLLELDEEEAGWVVEVLSRLEGLEAAPEPTQPAVDERREAERLVYAMGEQIGRVEAERDELREAAQRFSNPTATRREAGNGPPENDVLWVEVTMADWFRLGAALGNIDADYLRSVPPDARPSEAFIDALSTPKTQEEQR